MSNVHDKVESAVRLRQSMADKRSLTIVLARRDELGDQVEVMFRGKTILRLASGLVTMAHNGEITTTTTARIAAALRGLGIGYAYRQGDKMIAVVRRGPLYEVGADIDDAIPFHLKVI